MSNILLSICIPTFNRSNFLKDSINSIVSQIEFNESVELVISDNCSTDDTHLIVQEFQNKFSNIKYIRNKENVGAEKNIFNVLSFGEGRFLKLVNDYSIFNIGSLRQILDIITKYESDHSVIFFSNNRFKFREDTNECNNFDEFINKASFSITWIQYFGIWKEEFDLIMKGTFKEYNFPHLDLLLRNLDLGFKPVIFNRLLLTNPHQEKHGGYNIFETFIQNYLILLGHYIRPNCITEITFKNEKKKLLHNFVYPWYCLIEIEKDPEFGFSSENFNQYLTAYFDTWDVLIFRGRLVLYRFKKFIYKIVKGILLKYSS